MSPHRSNPLSTPVDSDTTTTTHEHDGFVIAWFLEGLTPLEDAPKLAPRTQTGETCVDCGEYAGRLNKLGLCRDCDAYL